MSLQERMKKYAELVNSKTFTNYGNDMLTDLQATMRALEVARENFRVIAEISSSGIVTQLAKEARETINQTIGKAGV